MQFSNLLQKLSTSEQHAHAGKRFVRDWSGEEKRRGVQGGRKADCFFGEECVAAAEPSSHGRVLYQPIPQNCTAQIKLSTVRLPLDRIVRHHVGAW